MPARGARARPSRGRHLVVRRHARAAAALDPGIGARGPITARRRTARRPRAAARRRRSAAARSTRRRRRARGCGARGGRSARSGARRRCVVEHAGAVAQAQHAAHHLVDAASGTSPRRTAFGELRRRSGAAGRASRDRGRARGAGRRRPGSRTSPRSRRRRSPTRREQLAQQLAVLAGVGAVHLVVGAPSATTPRPRARRFEGRQVDLAQRARRRPRALIVWRSHSRRCRRSA